MRATFSAVMCAMSRFCLFFPLLLPAFSLAQTQVDIDQINRQNQQIIQQEQQRRSQQQQEQLPVRHDTLSMPEPAQKTLTEDTRCFQVSAIVVNGVTLINEQSVKTLIQPMSNQCIGVNGINELLKSITQVYFDKGYVTTRAYVPEQNLQSGQLQIQVLEGRVSAINTEQAVEVNPNNAFPGVEGGYLNLREIEQGIEQLNRLSSNNVQLALRPGQEPGTSEMVLVNQAGRDWQLQLGRDNSGQPATGEWQNRLFVSKDNLFGLNDYAYANLQTDSKPDGSGKKSQSLSFHYDVPWGYWLYSLDGSWFEYNNRVLGQNQIFDTSGNQHSVSFSANRILFRDQTSKTSMSLGLTRKSNENFIEDVKLDTSSRTLTIANVGFEQVYYFEGAKTLRAKLAYHHGLRWLGALNSDAGPDPQFDKWQLSLSYQMPVTFHERNYSFSSSLTGQLSDDTLFGSESISIGGLYSVRGYKGESLSGRSGAYWRNDLSTQISLSESIIGIRTFSPFIAFDVGTVLQDDNTDNTFQSLSGSAIGLNLYGKHFNANLTYARPLHAPESLSAASENWHFSFNWQF